MAEQKVWEANAKQKKFMEILKENPDGLTLAEISQLAGEEIKSGSINCLIAKGLVDNSGEKEVLVQAKRKVKVYKLV